MTSIVGDVDLSHVHSLVLQASAWAYLGEGAANVVVAYTGTNELLVRSSNEDSPILVGSDHGFTALSTFPPSTEPASRLLGSRAPNALEHLPVYWCRWAPCCASEKASSRSPAPASRPPPTPAFGALCSTSAARPGKSGSGSTLAALSCAPKPLRSTAQLEIASS